MEPTAAPARAPRPSNVLPSEEEIDRIVLPADSPAHQVTGDIRLYLGAGYALLMQVAHPTNRVVGWFERTRGFLVGVREEMRKVTWPTRDELIKATRMIIVLSIVLGITIGLMDWVLQLILVDGVARLAR